ncbi:MAG TPA: TMEM165/GDT1 family protein [Chthonomonadaceae bacterium]|nr:TMEM165/GDT1 family protein [Chthonomonadaceae bacterium]
MTSVTHLWLSLQESWHLILQYPFPAAYLLVLFSEMLVGDKALFTIGSLTVRYRLVPILFGITAAFMAKTLAAVLWGRWLQELEGGALVKVLSVATFAGMALVFWFRRSEKEAEEAKVLETGPRAALQAFAFIFFSEWCDPGQMCVVALVVKEHMAPFSVWLGAVLALMTKAVLAATVGRDLKKRIRRDILCYGVVCLCVVMAIHSAIEEEKDTASPSIVTGNPARVNP